MRQDFGTVGKAESRDATGVELPVFVGQPTKGYSTQSQCEGVVFGRIYYS